MNAIALAQQCKYERPIAQIWAIGAGCDAGLNLFLSFWALLLPIPVRHVRQCDRQHVRHQTRASASRRQHPPDPLMRARDKFVPIHAGALSRTRVDMPHMPHTPHWRGFDAARVPARAALARFRARASLFLNVFQGKRGG